MADTPSLLFPFSPSLLSFCLFQSAWWRQELSVQWISTWQGVGCFWTFTDWSLFSLLSSSCSDVWGSWKEGDVEGEKAEGVRQEINKTRASVSVHLWGLMNKTWDTVDLYYIIFLLSRNVTFLENITIHHSQWNSVTATSGIKEEEQSYEICSHLQWKRDAILTEM